MPQTRPRGQSEVEVKQPQADDEGFTVVPSERKQIKTFTRYGLECEDKLSKKTNNKKKIAPSGQHNDSLRNSTLCCHN